MQRRKFIQKISIASLAAGFIPHYSLANFLPSANPAMLIPLGATQTQIRHGALNLPLALKEKSTMPFDWLLQVQRNIFFKNGFTRSESSDLEIVSVLLQEEEELEALQIQLSPTATSLMIKDELVVLDRTPGLKKIPADLEFTQILIAELAAGEVYDFPLEEKTSTFVQLLEGEIICEEQALDLNTGLALENKPNLQIQASVDSRVLILLR